MNFKQLFKVIYTKLRKKTQPNQKKKNKPTSFAYIKKQKF